jgi:very-short-patch-repair endonuclease
MIGNIPPLNVAYQCNTLNILDLDRFKMEINFDSDDNSPPLEGCPQGGVAQPSSPILGSQGGVAQPSDTNDIVTYIHNIPIKRHFFTALHHNPELSQLAREKRKAGILSEVLFWQQVHRGKFHHIDFDRQRIIGSYIVDFYVKTLGLVIEIDGESHLDKMEYDAKRQKYLESAGLRVYRINDGDVKNNLDWVLQKLENYIVDEYGEKGAMVK